MQGWYAKRKPARVSKRQRIIQILQIPTQGKTNLDAAPRYSQQKLIYLLTHSMLQPRKSMHPHPALYISNECIHLLVIYPLGTPHLVSQPKLEVGQQHGSSGYHTQLCQRLADAVPGAFSKGEVPLGLPCLAAYTIGDRVSMLSKVSISLSTLNLAGTESLHLKASLCDCKNSEVLCWCCTSTCSDGFSLASLPSATLQA